MPAMVFGLGRFGDRRLEKGGPACWLGWFVYGGGEVVSAFSGRGSGLASVGPLKAGASSEPLPLASLRGAGISKLSVSGTGGSMVSRYGSVSPYGSLARGPDGRCPRPRRKGRRRSFIKLWCGRETSRATDCRGRRGHYSRGVPRPHCVRGRAAQGCARARMVHLSDEIVQHRP